MTYIALIKDSPNHKQHTLPHKFIGKYFDFVGQDMANGGSLLLPLQH